MNFLKTKWNEAMNRILIIDENKTSIASMSFPFSKSYNGRWQLQKSEEIGQEICDAYNKVNDDNSLVLNLSEFSKESLKELYGVIQKSISGIDGVDNNTNIKCLNKIKKLI